VQLLAALKSFRAISDTTVTEDQFNAAGLWFANVTAPQRTPDEHEAESTVIGGEPMKVEQATMYRVLFHVFSDKIFPAPVPPPAADTEDDEGADATAREKAPDVLTQSTTDSSLV
jgi:hypothetical protein